MTRKKPSAAPPNKRSTRALVAEALAWLERRGTRRNREGMTRYGIVATNGKVFGVSVAAVRQLGKRLGRDHALALALWETGWYEARLLAAFVDDPTLVTPAQMDRWTRDFDNWAVCDTVCFHLFDKTPHAWRKVDRWSRRREEFVKRAAFALLASLALHDKAEPDARFLQALASIEPAAGDGRNFVKKGVLWALRGIGSRNPGLRDAALVVGRRLAAHPDPSPRWIGKQAIREFDRRAARPAPVPPRAPVS